MRDITKQTTKTEKATISSASKKSLNRRLIKLADGYVGDIAALHMNSSSDVANLLQQLNDPNSAAFDAYLDGIEAAITNAIRVSNKGN